LPKPKFGATLVISLHTLFNFTKITLYYFKFITTFPVASNFCCQCIDLSIDQCHPYDSFKWLAFTKISRWDLVVPALLVKLPAVETGKHLQLDQKDEQVDTTPQSLMSWHIFNKFG